MAYSGQAEQVFQDALVSAFPTYESMEQLVRLLDVNLAEISRRGNLRDVVFDVVRWADRENRVPDLIRTAAAEQAGNPRLKQALRHVDDPLLVEDRWFAKHVPVATWLLGTANLVLLLLVMKVYFVNLVNTFRLLSTLAVVCLVAVAAWRLYAWALGKPVRARIGTLLRRLVAHSRLERRDWLAFAALAALLVLQTTAVTAAPPPITLSFDRESPGTFWKDAEYVLVRSVPNVPSEMELQGPERAGLRNPERFWIASRSPFSCRSGRRLGNDARSIPARNWRNPTTAMTATISTNVRTTRLTSALFSRPSASRSATPAHEKIPSRIRSPDKSWSTGT